MSKSSTAWRIPVLVILANILTAISQGAELSRVISEDAQKYELTSGFQNQPLLKMYSEIMAPASALLIQAASWNPIQNIIFRDGDFEDNSSLQNQPVEIGNVYLRKSLVQTNLPVTQFVNPQLDEAQIQSQLFPDVEFTNCRKSLCRGAEVTPLKITMHYDVSYQHLTSPETLQQLKIPYTLITYQQKKQLHSAFIQVVYNFDKIFSSALNVILVLEDEKKNATLLSYQIFLMQTGLLGEFASPGMISGVLREHTNEFIHALSVMPKNRGPASQQNALKSPLNQRIDNVIARTHDHLASQQKENKSWNFYSNLGDMYISQFLIFKSLLDTDVAQGQLKIDPLYWQVNFEYEKYKKTLFKSQLKDGSWEVLHDRNSAQGNINPTIYHYAALKIMGEKINTPIMLAARQFILRSGGLARASLFTKIMMALTGNAAWDEVPSIPYLIFDDDFLVNKKQFGQWIGPHVMPIGYLRKMQYQKKLGPAFDLSELWVHKPPSLLVSTSPDLAAKAYKPDESDRNLILKMLGSQKKFGSLGGYTLSTMFTLLAFDHYKHFHSDLNSEIAVAASKGSQFVEELYFNSGEGSYKGITCDGSYWDTALIAQGLVDSRYDKEKLKPTLDFLLGIQDKKSGGFGFGKDFEQYMDTDDTAEILTFMKKMNFQNAETDHGLQWLFSMQNTDGGWGAFDRNNNGNLILKIFGKPFEDSADLFDESSADVTGHVLESLGLQGYTIKNSLPIKKAVRSILKEQVTKGPNSGAWLGRWGVNYIYGTSAALIGLIKAGVSPRDPAVEKAKDWFLKCQNSWDGGFGESFLSYSHPQAQACHGLSTPSQTAWALNALIEMGLGKSEAATKAATYLVNSFENKKGRWVDAETFVGTGHPRIVPMDYPSYPWAFSLMALGRFQEVN
jgi:squalene-hopene/tetraprenyl-beta-curcumene cyclase